ncbi:MAG: DNA-3-methyladenine glycosylase I [Candidatus Hodarchaeota archaeon]
MKRCEWATSDPLMIKYHDGEWGVPVHDDTELFEFLTLEGAQAGLSWATILNKREGYRKAFENFNVIKITNYSEKKIEKLLQNEGIIRNKLKIKSTINNAQRFITIQEEYGSFNEYIWHFVDFKTIHNRFKKLKEIPASTDLSNTMSKELKKYGFTFVGPTICYAFMQSVGLVNDHLIDCFRWIQLAEGI